MRPGRLLVAVVTGYLLGTIPSADIAARLAARTARRSTPAIELRSTGSGNPGALNAAQQLGTKWGVAVLIADAAKGAAAGTMGRTLAGPDGAYLAATGSIAGHIAPVWSGFAGGKGVATSAGACLAVFPAYFPIDVAVAGLGAVGSRRTETSVQLSSVAWVVAALLWWRRRWPNGWGPEPTIGLPVFATAGAAMIVAKFAAARRQTPPAPPPTEDDV